MNFINRIKRVIKILIIRKVIKTLRVIAKERNSFAELENMHIEDILTGEASIQLLKGDIAIII